MKLAQNGWPLLPLSDARTFLAPNGKLVYTAPNAATVLGYIAWRWHLSIEQLVKATHNQGDPAVRQGHVVIHAWRPPMVISGTNTYSNHCSGLAMDIYGERHPYEFTAPKPYRDGFTQAQRNALRAIKSEVRALSGGVDILRLGIDFASPRRDGMHVELWCSASQLSRTANAIRSAGWIVPTKRGDISEYQKIVGVEQDDHHGTKTISAVKAYQKKMGVAQTGRWDISTRDAGKFSILRQGSRGTQVKNLQHGLLRVFPSYAEPIKKSGGADGIYGAGTEIVVKEFQERVGITPDGVVGPTTRNHLLRHNIAI